MAELVVDCGYCDQPHLNRRAPKDEFYGERSSKVLDPFGHERLLGHEIEKVTPEEMQRRYTEMMTAALQ